MTTRVLLFHEFGMALIGLRVLLQVAPDVEVVGATNEFADTMRLTIDLRPDVVVLDAQSIGTSASDAVRCVRHEALRTGEAGVLVVAAGLDGRLVEVFRGGCQRDSPGRVRAP
ncbi:hypothetical protein [Dactylosporangium sp. NPDC050588]|uniref:hypothetical protein n=1 Tax=Dactylosporangium sp. NPDC050588 TaxID=3157211 RepID=UPI0033F462B5